MSTITFKHGHKQILKHLMLSTPTNDFSSVNITFEKRYHAIYKMLKSTEVLPHVLNDIITEYITDIIEFVVSYKKGCIRFTSISCMINYTHFRADWTYYHYYSMLTIHNYDIISQNYERDEHIISLFNYYMKCIYNKPNYINMFKDSSCANIYKLLPNALQCHYVDFMYQWQTLTVNIHNHKMLKNMIVMFNMMYKIIMKVFKKIDINDI